LPAPVQTARSSRSDLLLLSRLRNGYLSSNLVVVAVIATKIRRPVADASPTTRLPATADQPPIECRCPRSTPRWRRRRGWGDQQRPGPPPVPPRRPRHVPLQEAQSEYTQNPDPPVSTWSARASTRTGPTPPLACFAQLLWF
jgi:hypothetical protein